MRSLKLTAAGGVGASLTFYPAGRQARHEHPFTQLSFLLGGAMVERHDRHEYRPVGHARGLKPAGERHDNEWGPNGALVFSLRLEAGDMERRASAQPIGWSGARSTWAVPRLVRAFLEADPVARTDAAWDLVAIGCVEQVTRQPAPAWLLRVRDALHDEPGPLALQDAADEAGVHRVYLSQAFHRSFGVPPSVYRHRVMVGRAIALVANGAQPLGAAAQDAGFADQAHMSRAIKAATGVTPAALRRALA